MWKEEVANKFVYYSLQLRLPPFQVKGSKCLTINLITKCGWQLGFCEKQVPKREQLRHKRQWKSRLDRAARHASPNNVFGPYPALIIRSSILLVPSVGRRHDDPTFSELRERRSVTVTRARAGALNADLNDYVIPHVITHRSGVSSVSSLRAHACCYFALPCLIPPLSTTLINTVIHR